MPTDLHQLRDIIETIVTFSGAIGFLWGAIKFGGKLSAIKDIPVKVDNLATQVDNVDRKVDKVDRKVENLTGQFEVFKTFNGRGR